ncbi:MAG: DNA polymerase III subunit beta [Planctomycetes bacterium]|nr:DNA polymerase III subunit beta [Planctomycetota bacterium]
MKITCDKNSMLETFQSLNTIIPTKSTMPVLQNIKITADDKTISIIGTDLEAGIQSYVRGETKEKGTVIIPAARFGAILRETPDEKIKIESDGNVAEIVTKDSKYRIMCGDVAEYPDFPTFNGKKAVEISARGLKEMVRKTIFATSIEVSRYALTGLLLEIRKKELRLVASDGKRLAYIKRRTEQGVTDDIKVIVPPKMMTLLEHLLPGRPDDDEEGGKKGAKEEDINIKLEADETQLKISVPRKGMPDALLFCRLIEGVFPDYENIVPADNDKKIELPAEELLSAMRRVALVTTDKLRATQMDIDKDKLTLLSRTPDVGEAKITLGIKYDSTALKTTFNPDYFIDVLRVIGRDNISLELKDKTSPAMIKHGKDYIYLVMPMTIEL